MNIDWKTLFFDANGRIGRQSFWIGWLALLAVNVVLGWIPVIGWILSLVAIYASVCVFSKRLHDMGKSGWLQVWPMVISIALVVVSLAFMGGSAAMMGARGMEQGVDPAAVGGMGLGALMLGLAFLIGVAFTLWVGLTPSQPEANKYGPAPAAPAIAA